VSERDKPDPSLVGKHFGTFDGVGDLLISPSWQGLKVLACEGHRREMAKRRRLRAGRKRRMSSKSKKGR
jgi:hypothetical protein